MKKGVEKEYNRYLPYFLAVFRLIPAIFLQYQTMEVRF